MGIQGLLTGLSQHLTTDNTISSNTKEKHNIREFANKSLAVDTSSWLYKASYSCAERIVEATESNKIDPTCERIVCNYIIKRCEELLANASLKAIILVFDGKRCPLKAVTNKERENKRLQSLKEARRLKAVGKTREAQDKYKACLKVTDWMADRINRAVTQKWHSMSSPKVRCIFSPYEADAQLAKLCIDGLADAVVTEDSDLLVYSAACGVPFPIIFKLDRNNGNCDVISMDWLLSPSGVSKGIVPTLRRCLSSGHDRSNNKITGQNVKKKGKKGAGEALLSHLQAMVTRESRQQGSGARLFVQSCILSGCDYAPSRLSGVGLVTAFKMIIENSHREPSSRFSHVLKGAREKILVDINDDEENRQNTFQAHDLYEELLSKSEAVFYHHYVLHPKSMKIAPIMTPKSSVSKTDDMKKTGLSNEQAHCSMDNKDRTRYYPCLKRFASDMSFIGSDQGQIESASSNNSTINAFSNTSKLLSSWIKQSQMPYTLSYKLNKKNPDIKPSPKKESEELNHDKAQPKRDQYSNDSRIWKNRTGLNPLSKYAFSTKRRKTSSGLCKVKEIREDEEGTLEKKTKLLQKVDNSITVLENVENVMQNSLRATKSKYLEGVQRSYGESAPVVDLSRRHKRVDSMSSVSSIDSPSKIQPISNGQKVEKNRKWSKYFAPKKGGDLSVSTSPMITSDIKNTDCCLERSRSCNDSPNIITPTSDNTQNMNSTMVTQSETLTKRKLDSLFSDDVDSDSATVLRKPPASYASFVHQTPHTNDIVDNISRTEIISISDIRKPRIFSPTFFPNHKSTPRANIKQTGAKFFKQSTMANKLTNASSHLTKRRSNVQSIKTFFTPLKTKK